ncbi:4-hydroxyphenylacetate catabolism regulatory protein HpaA [Chromobacterium sp. Beijing]|uniref:4-hydroxyphenylacetate catabolism regulatory protein HpaA n=1 Tax=Chromobacterium sp. Beijing TaxID=2735795 RepID=UPI001F34E80E|nr:4-hydroxyphenylacetate catabolism regulatory protein HpaA [Chromobacterium sp. Beijing]UJB30124.1 4-hydroxyphenylacetate catabolism regulatory protein HpaA [Chromobacterium sp. Beijing]
MSRIPRGLGARIPNIDIGKAYDSPYESVDIHCESFGRLAAFFGRNMPVHRHDRFLQLHYLASGDIRLQLEEDHYQARAPLLFLTPPTVPHAFITGPEADGHVLTLRQELARGWLAEAGPDALSAPFCVELAEVPAEWADMARRLPERLAQLQRESEAPAPGAELARQALAQLVLVDVLRLSGLPGPRRGPRRDEWRLYHRFNGLIEAHYREHWSLDRYAAELGVSEARLNDVCRRLADLPSKRLAHDRLLQEAKRLLIYSAASVHAIAYDLGFKDPAYFSRFFQRMAGRSPSDYRARRQA